MSRLDVLRKEVPWCKRLTYDELLRLAGAYKTDVDTIIDNIYCGNFDQYDLEEELGWQR